MKSGINIVTAAEEYIVDLTSQGKAQATIMNRKSFVLRFAQAATRMHRERVGSSRAVCRPCDLDPTYLSRFLAEGNFKPGNYNVGLVSLRSFFAYLERMRYIERDGAKWLTGNHKTAHDERTPKHYIPAADFPRLLDIAGELHPTDRIVMALALYTLCRQSEISGLQLKHLDLDGRTITMRRPKRKRWTAVGITPALMSELVTWLEWYARETGHKNALDLMAKRPDWHAVPRMHYQPVVGPGGRFVRGATYTVEPSRPARRMELTVKRVLKVLNVKGANGSTRELLGEGIHTIRRSGARVMFDNLTENLGQDKALLMVSIMLDHEDVKQTLLYIGRDIERDKLNAWLRSNDPFGADPSAPSATVTTLPVAGRSRAVEAPAVRTLGDDTEAMSASL